ncbi:50S ribosomal protein L4 [Candidatus Giovannonibacteria bacterium]|nr:50S ribosomal protein L4 [Candidatus Giovannonibacteria bacterium]
MKIDTYNVKGQKVGAAEVPEGIFGVDWRPALVKQVYDGERANARMPWADSKDRSQVRGGGKKPWKQKHLGRARHGSIRSPIWRGGGVTHGPLKERNYQVKINKKMKRGALFSLLSKKLKDNEIVLLDKFSVPAPKTKEAFRIFKNLREKGGFKYLGVVGGKSLVAIPKENDIVRSIKNLPFVQAKEPRNLNTNLILNHKYLVLDEASIDELKKTYGI